jgi:RHS repeat-associated protein
MIGSDGDAERFSYDPSGNLVRVERSGSPARELQYGVGRLVRDGDIRFLYDPNGQLVVRIEGEASDSPRRWEFSWDANDRLRSVTTPEGSLWQYAYDALGRRVSKQGPSGLTRFIWDNQVIVHVTHDEKLEATWIYGAESFEPVCTLQDGSVFSVLTDHLGTPRELVDQAGDVGWAARFRAWGRADRIAGAGGIDCPLRYPGQWFDEETGLHSNRFRYYDPDRGRYLSPDRLGLLGGLNPYSYPRNPITWTDPLGLMPCSAVGKGGKALRSWTRKNTAAGRLPRFSGRSAGYVQRKLGESGFRQDPNDPTQWYYPDGSKVRIDPPHEPTRGPDNGGYRGVVEPHYHKEWQDPYGNPPYKLDDYGRINSDPNRTHIIGK